MKILLIAFLIPNLIFALNPLSSNPSQGGTPKKCPDRPLTKSSKKILADFTVHSRVPTCFKTMQPQKSSCVQLPL